MYRKKTGVSKTLNQPASSNYSRNPRSSGTNTSYAPSADASTTGNSEAIFGDIVTALHGWMGAYTSTSGLEITLNEPLFFIQIEI